MVYDACVFFLNLLEGHYSSHACASAYVPTTFSHLFIIKLYFFPCLFFLNLISCPIMHQTKADTLWWIFSIESHDIFYIMIVLSFERYKLREFFSPKIPRCFITPRISVKDHEKDNDTIK